MARSPAYPQLPLPLSLEMVRRVYKGAHRATVDTDTVLTEMGYASRSGRALAALGALKQFGLIEGRDESLRVTQDALTLLEPMNDEEFVAALKEASAKPELFAELQREFQGQDPSESVVRSIAIRRFGFTETGAVNVAKSYAETMRFVQGHAGRGASAVSKPVDGGQLDDARLEAEGNVGSDDGSSRPSIRLAPQNIDTVPAENILQFRISPTSSVKVIFSGQVTSEGIQRLITHLELSKDAFAES